MFGSPSAITLQHGTALGALGDEFRSHNSDDNEPSANNLPTITISHESLDGVARPDYLPAAAAASHRRQCELLYILFTMSISIHSCRTRSEETGKRRQGNIGK